MSLGIRRVPQLDRNSAHGGRSFYFFDFDDNVVFLPTAIFLFQGVGAAEHPVSTAAFAKVGPQLGQPGPWAPYRVDPDPESGSFRRFRDPKGRGPSYFVEDMRAALSRPFSEWQGPSWEFFHYAVFNRRPIAIITARGHDPEVIRAGIRELCRAGHLDSEPSYLGIYPVSHEPTRRALGDLGGDRSIPELKRAAIISAVGAALNTFGPSPHHRFGMSDDDPHNIRLIIDAMVELKRKHRDNAFFVIDSSQDPVHKTEILLDGTSESEVPEDQQLSLFG